MKKIVKIPKIYLLLSIGLFLVNVIFSYSQSFIDYEPGGFQSYFTLFNILNVLVIFMGVALLFIVPKNKEKKFLVIAFIINIITAILSAPAVTLY